MEGPSAPPPPSEGGGSASSPGGAPAGSTSKNRVRVVKKGIDPEERRRRQENVQIQIRKAKQVEHLAKRRQVRLGWSQRAKIGVPEMITTLSTKEVAGRGLTSPSPFLFSPFLPLCRRLWLKFSIMQQEVHMMASVRMVPSPMASMKALISEVEWAMVPLLRPAARPMPPR